MRILFALILLIPEICLADNQTLIGGEVVKPGNYPEVVYITSGRSRCSAVIVGSSPGVILTAAHCVGEGSSIEPVQFVVNQQVFEAVCNIHPDYEMKYSYDFALCKAKSYINVKPASIAKKAVEVGDMSQLLGYGCTKPRKPDGSREPGGNDGLLRTGQARISQVDNGESGVGGGQYFWTIDDTALCFGDSGGPSMEPIDDPKTDKHVVTGINSRGNISTRSLLSGTYHSGFRNWALAWAETKGVKICGINKYDCHKPSPKPEPKPDPDDYQCIEERYNFWKYSNLMELWSDKLDACLQGDVLLPYGF